MTTHFNRIMSAVLLTFCIATNSFASTTDNDNTTNSGLQTGKQFEVIAHRGYWKTDASAQNSRTSLQKALALGIYGSEIDVWLTTDGGIIVNHDDTYDGVTIKNATTKQCRKLTLKNGEKMPTLRELLKIMKKTNSRTKLIIEIKDHYDDALNRKAASATVRLVKKMGVEDRVEYISFSDTACEQVIADDPNAKVAALTGDKSPAERKAKNYTGIDYDIADFRAHPDWVKEAHDLGMTVNVWTVNKEEDMLAMQQLGVDFLTTDQLEQAKILSRSK